MIQQPAVGADTYYRGGLSHTVLASGLLTLAPAAADYYEGVVMEHKIVLAASELVWVGTAGRWWFECVLFTLANTDELFAALAATLFDNPADLGLATVGTAGAMGRLWFCTANAVSGWLDTDSRSAIVNA
jgi:hypothetical protein